MVITKKSQLLIVFKATPGLDLECWRPRRSPLAENRRPRWQGVESGGGEESSQRSTTRVEEEERRGQPSPEESPDHKSRQSPSNATTRSTRGAKSIFE